MEIQLSVQKRKKLLGILFDNNLAGQPQVKKVRQTIIFKISILRKIRKYLPTPIRILYYNHYIKPHLEYCCSVWDNCSKSEIDTLIKLQKQAARLILETDRYAPSAPLFSKHQWQTFDQTTRERQAFKVCDTLDPKYGIRWVTRSAKLRQVISLEQNTNHFLIMVISNCYVFSSYLFRFSIFISNYVILNRCLQLRWITFYFRSVQRMLLLNIIKAFIILSLWR